jgi:hypothetical protein
VPQELQRLALTAFVKSIHSIAVQCQQIPIQLLCGLGHDFIEMSLISILLGISTPSKYPDR